MTEETESTALVVQPKRTVEILLATARDVDDGLINMSDEEMEGLARQIGTKADGVLAVLRRLETGAAELGEDIAMLSKRKSAMTNAHQRLSDRVAKAMADMDAPRVPGSMFAFVLKFSKSVDIKLGQGATAALYRRFPDLIERSYSWKKKEIRKLLDAGDESIKPFAEVVTTPYLDIDVKTKTDPRK